MKCVIEGNGVKVFGRAVHALARIGDEMWLDPLEKGLAVRSVNTTHSAYACFLFSPLFFQHYTPNVDDVQDNKAGKCKVSLKSVLPLFRSVSVLERSVNRCEIFISSSDNRVIFQFNCKHGITKTHNLKYQECEALKAVFPSHLCPNILNAQPKLLSDIVMQFPISQEEITLSMSPLRVKLKNFCEENDGCMKNMSTEMSLHPDEFDYFQVGVDSDITFCLKELRGLLSFAECHGLPVSVHCGAPGKPVSFSIEEMLLEAVVVLATLADPASENPSQNSGTREAAVALRDTGYVCPADDPIAGTSIADIILNDIEGPSEAGATGAEPQNAIFPAGEHVNSSQGSPVFNPASHMRKVLLLEADVSSSDAHHSVPAITPATYKIHSLLFGAVSSKHEDLNTLELPSLVCASDTEDEYGEDSGNMRQSRK